MSKKKRLKKLEKREKERGNTFGRVSLAVLAFTKIFTKTSLLLK